MVLCFNTQLLIFVCYNKISGTVSGELLCITCSNQMVDECVVVLRPEQRAGENYTVEWNIVFCHEVVQLHLQDKWERCTKVN